jgi:DNA-binding transcriptional MerR regulator
MESTLTASEVCAAAKCPPSSLRAWQNRNGLFPHLAKDGGWRRYTLSDAIGIRLVVLLTERGFAAQEVVNLVNAMRPNLEMAAQGYAPFVGIGRSEDSGSLEFRELKWTGKVLDDLGWFKDPVVISVDLGRITNEVVFLIGEMRDGGDAE